MEKTSSTNLKIKGNWNEFKGKLRKEYGFLTDNDLAVEEGKKEELLGKIQQKTGEAKENIINKIESL